MNEQEIILAKICAILAKPYFMIKRNGEFKKYLKCCGLGNYYIENEDYFEPYWYNGTWQNNKQEYNVFLGLDNVFTSLLKDGETKKLSLLIAELGNNINPAVISQADESDIYQRYLEELQNLYQLLGYELILKEEQFDVVPYSGNKERPAN